LQEITVNVQEWGKAIPQDISPSNWTIVSIIYIIGLSFFLMRFSYQIIQIILFIKKQKVQHCRGYMKVLTEGKYPTFSFFNYLFWDNSRSLPESESEQILAHELKHIWDKHSYDSILMELVKITLWFNPLVYLYQRELKLQHEYIADASAIRESDPKSYARLIVQTCFDHLHLRLAHSFFNRSEVKQRLLVIEKIPSAPILSLKTLLVLPLIALLLVSFMPVKQWDYLRFQNYQLDDPMVKNRFATAQGGLDNFYNEIKSQIQYPETALQAQAEGRVLIQFTVMPDGTLDDVEILRGFHKDCDQEALRAVKTARTPWLPAKVEGKIVKQRLSIPVSFNLD
ncbi:MAG: M56 family metallopeptidase, partial [Bacteroidota bacterium]